MPASLSCLYASLKFIALIQSGPFWNRSVPFMCLFHFRQCHHCVSPSCHNVSGTLKDSLFLLLSSHLQQPLHDKHLQETSYSGTFVCAGNTPELLLVEREDLVAVETVSSPSDRTLPLQVPEKKTKKKQNTVSLLFSRPLKIFWKPSYEHEVFIQALTVCWFCCAVRHYITGWQKHFLFCCIFFISLRPWPIKANISLYNTDAGRRFSIKVIQTGAAVI